jgi:hypothetical protein
MIRSTLSKVLLSCAISTLGVSGALAASGEDLTGSGHVGTEAGKVTIIVHQINSSGAIGSWTLVQPDNEHQDRMSAHTTLYNLEPGKFSLFAQAPEGATTEIMPKRNGVAENAVDIPQISFTLNAGDTYEAEIRYTFTQVGLLSVTSDPPGISFELRGPNQYVLKDVTPVSFPEAPEGQYTVRFNPPEGCGLPQPQSGTLETNGRLTLSVVLSCPAADKMREIRTVEDDEKLVIKTEGQEIVLQDVLQSAWYANDVFTMARLGIMAGYKDANGKPTGEFRPESAVSIGELAKIAHRLVGLDETRVHVSAENPGAQDEQWFAPFIASAEQKGWTIFSDATIDPVRGATRSEVVVTLLQVLEVPVRWPKGGSFKDVMRRTPFAGAIETAAGDGMISGYTDDSGEPTGFFGPEDPVNRAQIARLLHRALEIYRGAGSDITPASPSQDE